MSNARGDREIDRVADAKRWLKCKEICGDDAPDNPFDCNGMLNCLLDKCCDFEQQAKPLTVNKEVKDGID